MTRIQTQALAAATAARAASRTLAHTSTADKNAALRGIAAALAHSAIAARAALLKANRADLRRAQKLLAQKTLTGATLARLHITDAKLDAMAAGVLQVAALPDPSGQVTLESELDDGLTLRRVTCPFGVVAAIIEARPDAVVQLAALMIKSGNALILKAGAEARDSTRALVALLRGTLLASGLPEDAIVAVEGRQAAQALLALDDQIALVVPRGGNKLVQYVQSHTNIPVLGHADGVCHVYVDAAADPEQALAIVLDSKTQAPATCNACETVLVHRQIAPGFLPLLMDRLLSAGVTLHGCAATQALAAGRPVAPVEAWHTEYGDLAVALRVVDDLDAAIDHIHRHGSSHTDAIVTRDAAAAQRFLNEVDSAGVYLNASTRFSDGYRYGFGAEVGISTNKLHARGPVGLESLVTYKYQLTGHGHLVGDYASGRRHFRHEGGIAQDVKRSSDEPENR
ncbi:MAG TPA: glutamate-5-semialdehyde dehydrogenase [Terriglobales bacterium]|jgi:glutamate-5-semialdehyde dehydrogenase